MRDVCRKMSRQADLAKAARRFDGGLRPVLTQAARGGAVEDGRGGETPLHRSEKHRHDRLTASTLWPGHRLL